MRPNSLDQIIEQLETVASYEEKSLLLRSHISHDTSSLFSCFNPPLLDDPIHQFVLLALVVIQQDHLLASDAPVPLEVQQTFLNQLSLIEEFYQTLGGILGYHRTVLQLLAAKQSRSPDLRVTYTSPQGVSLTDDSTKIREAVVIALRDLPLLAEFYPVGGSGERLDLVNSASHEHLSPCFLPFLGRSLLEGLIQDLEGREFLAYKIYGTRHTVPIVMMTSSEKGTDQRVRELCTQKEWFGRPARSFFLISQPLVPLVSQEGRWISSSPLILALKPGGHGILWKLASERGVFSTLKKEGKTHCLVRQINNPLGGRDRNLLALAGIGLLEDKHFGLFGCERDPAHEEGVLVEKIVSSGGTFEYGITNVEYTELDEHTRRSSPHPANVNLLFAKIDAIEQVLPRNPLPGLILNMKSSTIENGREIKAGRLEATMQNIADQIVYRSAEPLQPDEYTQQQPTFFVQNLRCASLSSTKKPFRADQVANTPEKAFYDLAASNHALLASCGMTLAPWRPFDNDNPLASLFLFHPALGPLHEIVRQKIRGGSVSEGGELLCNIPEINLSDLTVEGSLCLSSQTNNVYKMGRCSLRNVRVRNRGIAWQLSVPLWKGDFKRHEALRIELGEGSEFVADNVVFAGDHQFIVPPRCRLAVSQDEQGNIVSSMTHISCPSWTWHYTVTPDWKIHLSTQQKAHHETV